MTNTTTILMSCFGDGNGLEDNLKNPGQGGGEEGVQGGCQPGQLLPQLGAVEDEGVLNVLATSQIW